MTHTIIATVITLALMAHFCLALLALAAEMGRE
jgi:hypothetical protein